MGNIGGLMGHARLPIVGLDESYDQPVAVGSWMICFVGEVLDFRDHEQDESDLPLVVEGWIEHGPKALVGHDGFWSIAAMSNTELHVVADYLGQKPIYYRPDVLAAGSEPDALAALGPTTPDEIYLSSVIKWGYCPQIERTPYREIKHVLPGEHVCMNKEGDVYRNIIDPLEPRAGDLRLELEAAVRRRVLAADVPVASLLSGGLDSSIVHTLAARHGDVHPLYVALEEDLGERLAVSAVGGEVREAYGYWPDDATALGYMQEPIDLGSLKPQILLSQSVPQIVCLTGDGADELFSGYGRAMRYDSQYTDVFHELPAWHLPRLDRVMMRHRVEVRSPFLARRVAEIALSLPYKARKNKQILRDLFKNDLPPGIAEGKKKPLRPLDFDQEKRSKLLVAQFRELTWP
jgi:asparagine synthase (glutamine-hydrolysing)